jgi:[ribosomal protein S5]-alanine N-acetyltransferase
MLLEGKTIRIRDYKVSDLNDYFEIVSDEKIYQYEFKEASDDYEHARQSLKILAVEQKNYENDTFDVGIAIKESDKLIGYLSCSFIDPDQTVVMIGFGINSKFWRQGYATEMLEIYLINFFENGGFRVFCSTHGENIATKRLLEKIGFVNEGTLRKSTWMKGQLCDESYYGMMKVEWEEMYE